MARPAEKARAMLNKWVAMRERGDDNNSIGQSTTDQQRRRNRRPHLATECTNLADAERYRNQIVREISELLGKLQNPASQEHTIREWNDDVNKKLREKYHWNNQIYKLGGLDYNGLEKKRRIEEGDVQIHYSYRYFGVAKDLPGAKELLAKEAVRYQQQQQRRGKGLSGSSSVQEKASDLYKYITPDYFGWRDEDDGALLEIEASYGHLPKRVRHSTTTTTAMSTTTDDDDDDDVNDEKQNHDNNTGPISSPLPKIESSSSSRIFLNSVPDYFDNVPNQDQVAKMILERKKQDLLEKYLL